MKKLIFSFCFLFFSVNLFAYMGDGLGNHKAKKNLEIPNSGTNTNSFKLYFYSNLSGTLQYSSIQGISGADPYLRISVPNNAGTEIPILDLHDTVMAFVTDGLTSIGGISDNRPSDINVKYGVTGSSGNITGNLTVQNNLINSQLMSGKWAVFSDSVVVNSLAVTKHSTLGTLSVGTTAYIPTITLAGTSGAIYISGTSQYIAQGSGDGYMHIVGGSAVEIFPDGTGHPVLVLDSNGATNTEISEISTKARVYGVNGSRVNNSTQAVDGSWYMPNNLSVAQTATTNDLVVTDSATVKNLTSLQDVNISSGYNLKIWNDLNTENMYLGRSTDPSDTTWRIEAPLEMTFDAVNSGGNGIYNFNNCNGANILRIWNQYTPGKYLDISYDDTSGGILHSYFAGLTFTGALGSRIDFNNDMGIKDKKFYFYSSDLDKYIKIYHDGSNGYIYPTTGTLTMGNQYYPTSIVGTQVALSSPTLNYHPTFDSDTQLVDKKYVDDAVSPLAQSAGSADIAITSGSGKGFVLYSPNNVWRLSIDDDGIISVSSFVVITVSLPEAGSTWRVDDTETIAWSAEPNILSNVDIDLSTDSGNSYPVSIAYDTTITSGSIDWTVPTTTVSLTCKLRIMEHTMQTNISYSGIFSIKDPIPGLVQTGMIGGWHFDENTGSTCSPFAGLRNITLVNTPTWSAGYTGFGYSVLYDGVSEYAGVTQNLSSSTVNDGSVCFWVKFAALPASNTFSLFAEKDGFENSINFVYLPVGGNLMSNHFNYAITSSWSPALNTWYHIAVCWTNRGTGTTNKIYVNGSEVGTRTITFGMYGDDCYQFIIGAGKGSGWYSNFANIYVDELVIYNRQLSAAEALQVYNHYQAD